MSATNTLITPAAPTAVSANTPPVSAPTVSALAASYRAAVAAAESVEDVDAYGAALATAERIAGVIADTPATTLKEIVAKLDAWQVESSAGRTPGPLSDRLLQSARNDLGRMAGPR